MGKLDHESHLLHFSHPHLLELTISPEQSPQPSLLLQPPQPPCSACKLPQSGFMYTCLPCNFTLHSTCTQYPQIINHTSHPTHSLSLLPTTVYPGGIFNCDACNRRGNGFSYHCSFCDFDLHVICASRPQTVTHHYHPDHLLHLTFRPPYETKGFSCDVCRKIGSKQWLYRCHPCEFDAHMDCVTATPAPAAPPPSTPRPNPFPGLLAAPRPLQTPYQQQQMPHQQQQQQQMQHQQQQMPYQQDQVALQHRHSFTGVQAPVQQQQQVPLQHHHSMPVLQNNYQQAGVVQNSGRVSGAGVSGTGLINAMFQGLVEGAAQQVGQSLMQGVIGSVDSGTVTGGDYAGDCSGDTSSATY